MTTEDAIAFLQPAVAGRGGTWIDLGAGAGLFSEALSVLLGPRGQVIALDRDRAALHALSTRARREAGAAISTVTGDFEALGAVDALRGVRADGLLFANALHYARDAAQVLATAAGMLVAEGRLVVIEYDRREANPWVPYPLPLERLAAWARTARWEAPRVVGRRTSIYGGDLYLAVLIKPNHPPDQTADQ